MSSGRPTRAGALAAASVLLCASCGLNVVGSGPEEGDAPNGSDAAIDHLSNDGDSSVGPNVDGGGVADGSADAGVPLCIAAAPSMLGWWTADVDLNDRGGGGHNGVSGTQAGASAVGFGAGQVAGAFDLRGASYVQIANAPTLQITAAITMDAWISAAALGGRIVDKITAGGADGYMLDTYSSKLRLIIRGAALSSPANLPVGVWTHVAATWDGAMARVFVNGAIVASAAISGSIPKTTLALRVGADSTGNTRFSGKIDEVGLYDRALTTAEIGAIFAAGPNGRCKP